ncbi:MAG: uridine kinase [Spirochaetia bacterium]|jgi:uridine kinase
MEKDVRIVGIAGGSGSGKTTIVTRITEIVRDHAFVAQDNYYKSAEYLTNQTITDFNFDHPDAFDTDLLFQQLQTLKSGRPIQMPQYDFVHHRRREDTVLVEPRRLVIFEGIMIYFDKRVRDLIDLKLYVDTPDDIRFIRRLRRDITERGRTVESVIAQYMDKVRPGHYEFVEPTKAYADLVIPEGGFNERAMEALIPFLRQIAGPGVTERGSGQRDSDRIPSRGEG